MSVQTKKVRGELLDPASKKLLADVLVEIALVQPQNSNDRPEYRATATVKGYRPELDNKSFILRLNETVTGGIFISISGIPDLARTCFTVFLQDSIWNSLDWFQSL